MRVSTGASGVMVMASQYATMVTMGISQIQPEHMGAPAAKYAHAVKVDGAQSMVFTSNMLEILRASQMGVTNIVSITTYVVARDTLTADLASVMAVRDEVMADHRAASTLVTVPALARAEWLIEISLVAAS
jgi:enamine deaminase RidA (YjgF/YER057c/UK114 family)